jgi:hypothetical protein
MTKQVVGYCNDDGNAMATNLDYQKKNLSQLNHEQIQSLATLKCKDAYCSSHCWNAEIFLPLYPVEGGRKGDIDPLTIKPAEVDVCSFFDGKNGFIQKLYFCPTKYPPIKKGDSKEVKESKLRNVDSLIKSRAKKAGSLVVIGGSSNNNSVKDFFRDYMCGCCNSNNSRKSGGKKSKLDDEVGDEAESDDDDEASGLDKVQPYQDGNYRESHLVNNTMKGRRKGSGRGGKGLKRRRNTVLRSTKPCPFRFRKKVDTIGFYISLYNGSGNSYHQCHPKFDPDFMPTQLSSLTQEEIDDMTHVKNATVSNAACREVMAAKFDKYIPTAQMRYLNSLPDEGGSDEYGSLVEAFQNNPHISLNILWSIKQNSEDVVLSSTKILGEVTQEVPLLQGNERELLHPVAASAIADRKSRCMDDEQVFHCIAWTNEGVLRYFLLCPEVVTFDVTSHTNKSGFNLLTFSCRTSIDKQVVFCRVWIPNQRRASFRYVFQEALPKILPKHVFKRVMFLICDGDAQQNLELRIAIKMLFPHGIIGGCAFHLFENGWNRHVVHTSWNKSKKVQWMRLVRGIHTWLHSWTRPGFCLSQEEYEISKYLLLACLTSKCALKMAGNDEYLISSAVKFVKDYVFPNEPLFLFYPRKSVFHLCVATTSAHEGTNHGLKSHTAGVKATHALDTAAKAMSVQDLGKKAQCDLIVGRDFSHRDKSSWSQLTCAPYLLTYAVGLMEHSFNRAKSYKIRRVGETQFQVVFAGKNCDPAFVRRYIDDWPSASNKMDVDVEDNIHDGGEEVCLRDGAEDGDEEDCLHDDVFSQACCPLFSRAYTVDLNKKSSTCECCHFDHAGYPCPHMNACAIAVCEAQDVKFNGFGQDSVKVRWWTDYLYWGYRSPQSSEEEELVKLFHHLANNDVRGPKFHYDIPSSMPIMEPVAPLPATERIKNYPKDSMPSLLKNYKNKFDGLLSSTTHITSGSQEMDDCLDDDEIVMPIITDLRNSSDAVIEEVMTSVSDVASTQTGGCSYRAALYPHYNEMTDLLQQVNDPEVAKNTETVLKNQIDYLHRLLRERSTSIPPSDGASTSTLPASFTTSTSLPTPSMSLMASTTSPTTFDVGNNRPWTSINGAKQYQGPARVHVAKNSKFKT